MIVGQMFMGDLDIDASLPNTLVKVIIMEKHDKKPKGICENCLKPLIKHPLINITPNGHQDWCLNCNDEDFIKTQGRHAHALWVLHQINQGYALAIVCQDGQEPDWKK